MENRMSEKIAIDEVCRLVQISRSSIYRRIKLGTFPAPVKVPTTAARGPKTGSRWDLGQVMDWARKHDPAGSCVQDLPPIDAPRSAPRGAFVAAVVAASIVLGAALLVAIL